MMNTKQKEKWKSDLLNFTKGLVHHKQQDLIELPSLVKNPPHDSKKDFWLRGLVNAYDVLAVDAILNHKDVEKCKDNFNLCGQVHMFLHREMDQIRWNDWDPSHRMLPLSDNPALIKEWSEYQYKNDWHGPGKEKPLDYFLLMTRTMQHLSQKRFAEAKESIQEAISSFPKSGKVYSRLIMDALLCIAEKDQSKAQEAVALVLKSNRASSYTSNDIFALDTLTLLKIARFLGMEFELPDDPRVPMELIPIKPLKKYSKFKIDLG